VHAGGVQARSPVFAVPDDFEEHAPEDLHLVLAVVVQNGCLGGGAGAGYFRAQGVSGLGDFRNSCATVAWVAAAHDETHALEPV
jgi:hypothetical protein